MHIHDIYIYIYTHTYIQAVSDGVTLLSPECFVTEERFRVPEANFHAFEQYSLHPEPCTLNPEP
jgi:hypothetical protein